LKAREGVDRIGLPVGPADPLVRIAARGTQVHPLDIVIAICGGYLIGSIPIAFLVTRLITGRDIRRLGTGNVGVMNTVRQAGFPAGMLVFAGEGSKGVAAYGLGRYLGGGDERIVLLSCLAALIGVNWSIFLGFSGGRGTTYGAFVCAILAWKAVLLGAAIWLAVYLAFRDSFLATRVNILLLPLVAFLMTRDVTVVAFALAASLVLLYRHRRETDDRLQLTASPAAVSSHSGDHRP
jgi:glycerol-3-phosphate acyltransferase PlsY